jgi:hypothetical protein
MGISRLGRRRKGELPRHRLHKQSRQAIVSLPLGGGQYRDVLLGEHGSEGSRRESERVIHERIASGRVATPAAVRPADRTVAELCLRFWRHAEGDDLATVRDAAAGLTRMEAEDAFSLSLVRRGRVVPEALWGLKTQALKKSGLPTPHKGGETFADLGGLEALKGFTRRALGNRKGSVRARSVLLLGVAGTGKSAFATASDLQTSD